MFYVNIFKIPKKSKQKIYNKKHFKLFLRFDLISVVTVCFNIIEFENLSLFVENRNRSLLSFYVHDIGLYPKVHRFSFRLTV